MENRSKNILEVIIEKAKREHKGVNIYAHEYPDGDAIASSKTLEKVLQDNGIRARYIVKNPRVNNRYKSVVGETLMFKGRVAREDISVILDSSTMGHMENKLFTFSRPENIFVIDHHKKEEGKSNIEDDLKLPKQNICRIPEASSTCEILAGQLKEAGLLNQEYATKLLVGLWTDTAKFRYIKKESLNSLNMLLASGANFDKVKSCLEAKRFLTPEVGMARALLHTKKIKIGSTYLNYFGLDNETVKSIEEKYGTKFIQKKVFKLMDTEDTSLAVAITENMPNNFFCEFRSSEDLGNVDVFSVATSMGGGGHYNASGCTIKSEQGIEKISRDVLTTLTGQALPNLVGIKKPEDTEYDIELKQILDSMDRFNRNLNPENLKRIQELISLGARYQSVYDEKISFQNFMVRNSILTQIPDEQLKNRRISFKLSKRFLEDMQSKYNFSPEDVLSQIELFKEIDVDYVVIDTPTGKSASIDAKGNISFHQKEDIQEIKG